MYKIIRNLNLVPPPTQGWDNRIPPTSTETTIGDDVERIRRSRNDIVHNVNTNISDLELENRFSCFIDIASRLEVYLIKRNREFVSRIEDVKTRCLDPETEESYLRQLEILSERETIMQSNISAVSHSVDELRQQSNMNALDISGLNTKVTTLQTDQEETMPKNIRDQINKDIEEWKTKDNKFVPTRASAYVVRHLNKKSCLTLTGSPGVGKTFVARHIALKFQSEGYMIIPIETPIDIRDYYTPGKRTLFLVDDICGKFIANQTTLENWQQMLPKIKQILADKCIKIIATCRLQVYRDTKFSSLEPFKIFECNLNSQEMCLTQSEKTKMKEIYLGNKNFDDSAQLRDFSPLTCSLQWLSETEGTDVNNLFENPFDFYQKELDNLNNYGSEGRQKICSLLLCVLFNNYLEEKWFEGRITDEQRQVLDDVYIACRLNSGTPKTELMDALDTLDGSLVCKRNVAYSAIHDKIFDFLAHYFGGRMMRCLIDHSDSYFINERFQWKTMRNLLTTDIAFAIELTDETLQLYFDRLVKDWSEGKVTVVITNSNMNDESFRNHFISYLMKLEKTEQVKLANTQDILEKKEWGTSGSYAMVNACFLGYIDIVRWLLGKVVDVSQCRDDGNNSLLMACYNGHKDIVSLLLQWNHSVNGYTEIVEELLESNADVNIGIEDGIIRLSPLSQATTMDHFDIVKKLLEKTPDVNFSGTDRYTPLSMACQANNTEIARILIINKADVCARTNIGATALHLAVANGNIEITRLLLKLNVNYNSRIKAKEFIYLEIMLSLLHPCTSLEDLKQHMFNFIVQKESKVQQYVSLKSEEYVFDVVAGSSSLHIACFMGYFEIIECLLQNNANINLPKLDGTTPLFYACELGHDNIVCLLLDKGAETSMHRKDGKSPLSIAQENGHTNIEMKLRRN
ncbi:ANK [Mytilus coruscus]|uniref:ANK n=1 Tax=Mytilus coruscus TaxID=42192 RepID=A0A6J8E7B1_MYTCO|nr:ANK [Mytilus coruscus]